MADELEPPPSTRPAEAASEDESWTLIGPKGERFTGKSPLRAASAAARSGILTDPVKAKHFHDALESLRAENEAENARLLAEHGTLNCPSCSGSGHIGDVKALAAEAPQEAAHPDAPAEVYLLPRGEGDDMWLHPAVVDGPGPHGFIMPSVPKRMAVRYVLATASAQRDGEA